MATIYGFRACQCMVDSLPMIEDRLRQAGAITRDLSGLIAQGAYSDGSLSAGTHSGGGAIDVAYSTVNTTAKVLAWRTSGVAMWPRTELDSAKFGGGNRHGHGIWIGCPHHPAADYQVTAYRNGRDGLVGARADRYPRPPIVTWQQALTTWKASNSPAGGSAPRPAPGPTTTTEEDDMTVRDVLEGREKLNKAIPAQQWTSVPLCAGSDLWGWEEDNLVRIVGEAALPVPEGTVLRFFAVDKALARVKTWPEAEGQTRQISTKLWGHHQLGLEVWSPKPIVIGWTTLELVVFESRA